MLNHTNPFFVNSQNKGRQWQLPREVATYIHDSDQSLLHQNSYFIGLTTSVMQLKTKHKVIHFYYKQDYFYIYILYIVTYYDFRLVYSPNLLD